MSARLAGAAGWTGRASSGGSSCRASRGSRTCRRSTRAIRRRRRPRWSSGSSSWRSPTRPTAATATRCCWPTWTPGSSTTTANGRISATATRKAVGDDPALRHSRRLSGHLMPTALASPQLGGGLQALYQKSSLQTSNFPLLCIQLFLPTPRSYSLNHFCH